MKDRLDKQLSKGIIPIHELLDQYGDMPLCDFADLAISYGLIPLPFLPLAPYDELAIHPQWQTTRALSAQRELAS